MILITGVSGFIGKPLLLKLVAKYGKENVIAFTSKEIKDINCLIHGNYMFDKKIFVEKGLEEITTIIHAGAFTPKSNLEANNLELCNSNISNTQKLLEADLPKLKQVIFLSTLDVYDASDKINEQSLVNPVSLYGNSKYYCEKYVEKFSIQSGVDYKILRIGHVYGPGEENYKKIIPVTIKKIINSEKIDLFGFGDKLRSFIFIDDVIDSIINSIGAKEKNQIINIVGSRPIKIYDLILLIARILDNQIEFNHFPPLKGDRDLIFDNTKMLEILKIKETPIEIGLEKEISYMRNL
jgi:nucleoside-diphosphate-sugar epimerase